MPFGIISVTNANTMRSGSQVSIAVTWGATIVFGWQQHTSAPAIGPGKVSPPSFFKAWNRLNLNTFRPASSPANANASFLPPFILWKNVKKVGQGRFSCGLRMWNRVLTRIWYRKDRANMVASTDKLLQYFCSESSLSNHT